MSDEEDEEEEGEEEGSEEVCDGGYYTIQQGDEEPRETPKAIGFCQAFCLPGVLPVSGILLELSVCLSLSLFLSLSLSHDPSNSGWLSPTHSLALTLLSPSFIHPSPSTSLSISISLSSYHPPCLSDICPSLFKRFHSVSIL